MLEKPAHRPC